MFIGGIPFGFGGYAPTEPDEELLNSGDQGGTTDNSNNSDNSGDNTNPSGGNNWLGAVSGLAGMMTSAGSNNYVAPTKFDNLGVNNTTSDDMDDLMSRMSSNRLLHADRSDYVDDSPDAQTADALGFLGSAAKGAITGSSGGIAGTILGLVVGGATGAASIMQKRSAQEQAWAKDKAKVEKINAYNKAALLNDTSRLSARKSRLMAAQAAYGGPLGISLLPVGGAIDYMQNEELLASFNDSMSKNNNNKKPPMPVFAFGGALGGYGGDWSNGLNFIKAGGTHGENPIGGVPMGVAQDGMPNLVEEGEVVWNDYVFSNRINVPKETMERLGIKGKDTMTFAEAVEKAQKSSAERPNDPIEKRGLDAVLAGLMQKQEEIRQSKAEKEQFNEMEDMAAFAADGGPIHIAKNKKGTFTAAATKHGMGVQEFAGHVLANKDKYSPAMVKKANFARNASKWHHALGGHLFPWGGHFDPRTGEWVEDDYMMMGPHLPDDSPINRYTAATNPMVVSDNVLTRNTVINSSNPSTNKGGTSDLPTSGWQTYLRYAPVLGSAIGLGYTLLNQPDYEYANELEAAASQYTGNIPHISYSPLGDYMAYNPFDRLFYANELGAQQAATRSAIMNSSNGNAGQAMAALLASGYNDNIGLGRLYREAEEYNLAQRQKVAEFNRATNQYNSEADLKTQMFNAEQDRTKASLLLDAKMKALGLKQAEDQAWDTSLAANLTGLFDNIGNIGWEAVNRNMIRTNPALYYDIDSSGHITYKGMDNLSESDKDYIRLYAERDKKKQGFSNGGYLTIKNRRRR